MGNSNLNDSLLVFSDLDGSLLDHVDYSWSSAQPALQKLQQAQIPLIFNTSKTLPEVIELRSALANPHPFICENGAAIYIPKAYFAAQPKSTSNCTIAGQDFWYCQIGETRDYWQKLLLEAAPDHSVYRSFAQLGKEQIARATGLSIQQSANANQRKASEVIHWLGNSQEQRNFISSLQNHGAQILQGGRFLHLLSPKANKGSAMQWLTAQYQQSNANTLFTVAIGDSANDIPMLEISDYAIVIRRHSIPSLILMREDTINIYTSDSIGSLGWNNSLLQLLNNLQTRFTANN